METLYGFSTPDNDWGQIQGWLWRQTGRSEKMVALLDRLEERQLLYGLNEVNPHEVLASSLRNSLVWE
jgi:hypothetical protein